MSSRSAKPSRTSSWTSWRPCGERSSKLIRAKSEPRCRPPSHRHRPCELRQLSLAQQNSDPRPSCTGKERGENAGSGQFPLNPPRGRNRLADNGRYLIFATSRTIRSSSLPSNLTHDMRGATSMNGNDPVRESAPIPPDDLRRQLTVAQPDDPGLAHIAVVGDTYTVLLAGDDTAGHFTLIDMYVPPGGGPPPHRHDFEETFVLLEGELDATFRGNTRVFRAGETINIPSNAPHQFRNAS